MLHRLLPGGSLGEKATSTQQVQPSAHCGAAALRRLGEEVSAPRLWVRPCRCRSAALGRAVGRQRGGVGLFLMVLRLIVPNLTLAGIYWPIVNSCSDSELMKLLT